MKLLLIFIIIFILTGCGGGGGSSSSTQSIQTTTNVGIFIDAPVSGLEYSSASYKNRFTDSNGYFKYSPGESVTFKIGQITLGTSKVTSSNGGVITPLNIIPNSSTNDSRVIEVLRVLQSLDSDNNPANGIKLTTIPNTTSINLSQAHTPLNDSKLASLIGIPVSKLTTSTDAKNHFNNSLKNINSYKTTISKINTSKKENENYSNANDNDENENHSSRDNDSDGDDSGSSNNGTNTTTNTPAYTLLAWNDLGMHCFDGSDFSIFSILPPYNNLNAQLINNAATSNKHVINGVTITYESLKYNTHINTSSSTKTNFWSYLTSLFPNNTSVLNTGLTGNKTPSTIPHSMTYNSSKNWWEASAIPIINRDDNNLTDYYPMVKVVAKDSNGNILATANVVLPVSDEMDCAKCHASTVTSTDAKPTAGWENNIDTLKDYKLNILKLHDQNHIINSADLNALKSKGYIYKASLYDTAKSGTPILCASCHSSNVLNTINVGLAKALTTSLHSKHATVKDPSNNLILNNSSNRDACYSCHPGAATKCLRGAMGNAKDINGNQIMQCQSCHGTMSDVGDVNRSGWQDEPNCQTCHQNAQRYTSALVSGSLRTVIDTKFATNPNTPSSGISLYRYSIGHGNLQCSSCHGSTHAIFPTSHTQDNIQSINIQGHSGSIAECTSCHATVPSTTTGGPHGMHTVGQSWVNSHKSIAKSNSTQCTICHGSDYRGTVLSETFTSRSFNAENITKTYSTGDMVSCYDCHNKKW